MYIQTHGQRPLFPTVLIPDWNVVPWVCVLVQSMIESTGQAEELQQVHTRLGVKSKASTKFIERRTKHPNEWDLVKELRHGITKVHEII
jgi:hypothetical protein